jgi:hypothetical protein
VPRERGENLQNFVSKIVQMFLNSYLLAAYAIFDLVDFTSAPNSLSPADQCAKWLARLASAFSFKFLRVTFG